MRQAVKLLTVMGGAAAVAASPLLTGLVSYWTLNEASGNRLDSVGGRTMVPQGTVGAAAGKLGNCATFAGGSTNHLLTAADAGLTAINWEAGFTVAGWYFYPASGWTDRSAVLSRLDGNDYDFRLISYAANAIRFVVNDSITGATNASTAIDATSMSADTWYFFAGRYNPSSKKAEISVNGGSWTLAGGPVVNNASNTYTYLAINRTIGDYGASQIDEVGMWSRYLSDAEVLQLYNSGTGLTYPLAVP